MSTFPYGQWNLLSNAGLDSFTNRGRAGYVIVGALVISPPA